MKASSAQDAIRAIPDKIAGTDAADMLHNYAEQVRAAVKAAPNGIIQQTYGLDTAIKAADDIDNAATQFRLYQSIVRPSADYSRLQTLVGRAVQEIYGIDGQVEVFQTADAGFVQDLKDNIAKAVDVGGSTIKWVVVGAVAILLLVLLFRFGGRNA